MTFSTNVCYLLLTLLLPLQYLTANDHNNAATKTYTLSGKVTDERNGEPLAFAAIIVRGQGLYTATTDFNGHYKVTVPKGEHTFLVTYTNYEQNKKSLVVKRDGRHDVRMNRLPNRYESRAWFVDRTEVATRDNYVVGTVADGTTGVRLIGATVTVKGTKIATNTDFDGTYQLHVPAGKHTLVYSYVGYTVGSSDIDFNEDKRVDVKMYADGAADVRVYPAPATIDGGAKSTAPADNSQRASSLPFADNSVLVLVNGKKVSKASLKNLDPATVESMNVIKDAEQVKALGHGASYKQAVIISLK